MNDELEWYRKEQERKEMNRRNYSPNIFGGKIEVTKRMGGFMIRNIDTNMQFMITYGSFKITHVVGFNVHVNGVHLFDSSIARKISEYLKRFSEINKSKYTDWRYFAKGYTDDNLDAERKSESDYMQDAQIKDTEDTIENENEINESLITPGHLNEGLISRLFGGSAPDPSNPKKHASVIKILARCGLIAGITMICPAIGILKALYMLNSLHTLTQEKMKKMVLTNPDLLTDKLKSENITKEMVEKGILDMNTVYWAEYSNGEVARVIASTREEARDAAKILLSEGLDRCRKESNDLLASGTGAHAYRVYLKGGEIALCAGKDKYEAMEKAQSYRTMIYDVYHTEKSFSLSQGKTYDEKIKKMEAPKAYEVTDLGAIPKIESPMSDDEHISITESEPRPSFDNDMPLYKIEDMPLVNISISAKKKDDAEYILQKLARSKSYIDFVNQASAAYSKLVSPGGNGQSVLRKKVEMVNGDSFTFIVDTSSDMDGIREIREKTRKIASKQTQGNIDEDEMIAEEYSRRKANEFEKILIEASKSRYRGERRMTLHSQCAQSTIDDLEMTDPDYNNSSPINIPKEVTAVIVDSDTGASLSSVPFKLNIAS